MLWHKNEKQDESQWQGQAPGPMQTQYGSEPRHGYDVRQGNYPQERVHRENMDSYARATASYDDGRNRPAWQEHPENQGPPGDRTCNRQHGPYGNGHFGPGCWTSNHGPFFGGPLFLIAGGILLYKLGRCSRRGRV
ncbi:hypothetical protein DICA3_C17216 [Diutina catenulata]